MGLTLACELYRYLQCNMPLKKGKIIYINGNSVINIKNINAPSIQVILLRAV